MAVPPPPTLRATLVVFAPSPIPPVEELRGKDLGIEGVEWSAAWPPAGAALLRIPLLLPGARLGPLVRGVLGGPAVMREVREFRALVAAARDALEALALPPGGAYVAMADALEALPPGTTMLDVERRLRGALGSRELGLASLSHYDALVAGPRELDPSWIAARVGAAYGGLTGRPVAVVLRPLGALEALLGALPLR